MPFKIIQMTEDNGVKLSITPAQWENKGALWWPPKSYQYLSDLIKDEHSRPRVGWATMKCVVKKRNIESYQEANRILYEMLHSSDADSREPECDIRVVPPQRTARNSGREEIHLEEIMGENLNNSKPLYEQSFTNGRSESDEIHIQNSEDIKTVLANQELILTTLNAIIDNQKKIAHKVTSLSARLDETNMHMANQLQQPISVALSRDAIEESDGFSLKPIETNEEFERFEMFLADKAQKRKVSNFLSILCSPAPGRGVTCAYKLIDVLFTREFLCKCSWSGGSRGEICKITFKKFVNFRMFFFDMIRSWDPTFTGDDMENFFKMILKNSLKRATVMGLRASTKKNRRSKKDTMNILNQGKASRGNDGVDAAAYDGDDRRELDANEENDREEVEDDDGNDYLNLC